jgi:hypothetical protein
MIQMPNVNQMSKQALEEAHKCFLTFFFFLVALGFELRASLLLGRSLSHSTSPVLWWVFLS